MQGSNSMSSFNRDPLPSSLPRVETNYNDRSQAQGDFSNVLDNNELIFGGDRPSNLMNRSKSQPHDYNYRASPMSNENFSFPSLHGDQNRPHHNGNGDHGQRSYLNERMQF